MEQSGQIGAWGHAYARKGFLNRAGATYSRAGLKHQHALPRTCQVRCTGKAVVAAPGYNHIPTARGQVANRSGQSNFAEDSGRG